MKELWQENPRLIPWVFVGIPLIGLFVYLITPEPTQKVKSLSRESVAKSGSTATVEAGGRTQAIKPAQQQPGDAGGSHRAPPTSGRGQFVIEEAPVSSLYELLENEPQSIKDIVFTNGSNSVLVIRKDGPNARVILPDDGGKKELREKAAAAKVKISVTEDSSGFLLSLVGNVLPVLLIILLMSFLFSRGGVGSAGQFAGYVKSRAKKLSDHKDSVDNVTWADVAGCDEAVEELKLIAASLKKRKSWFKFFRQPIPKGVLLVGPPGTGKTLLVKVTANEIDADVTVCNGAEFLEMFKGTGAAKMRDTVLTMNREATKSDRLQVLFIDEIDAFGQQRSNGLGDSSETLIQLLAEMDGVINNDKIIFFAATNRVDILDEALLRPGRFSKQVIVDAPDMEGRRKILDIHLRGRKTSNDVDLDSFAGRLYGFTGAMIKGAIENAGLMAIRRIGKKEDELAATGVPAEKITELLEAEACLTAAELDAGADEVFIGLASHSKQRNIREKDKQNTAVHEAGHARLSKMFEPYVDPVAKVTIVKTGGALGYVLRIPDFNKVSKSVKDAVGSMIMAMAGRAAQIELLDECDSGARGDFQQVSDTARSMVCDWGMSRLGHFSMTDEQVNVGRTRSGQRPKHHYGPDFLNAIDREWLRIQEACYAKAIELTRADKNGIRALADLLLQKETVLAEEFNQLAVDIPVPKVDMAELVQEILFPAEPAKS